MSGCPSCRHSSLVYRSSNFPDCYAAMQITRSIVYYSTVLVYMLNSFITASAST